MALRVARKYLNRSCSRRVLVIRRKDRTTTQRIRIVEVRRIFLPLLGERAGVRADVHQTFISFPSPIGWEREQG